MVPSICLNHAVAKRSPPSGTAPSLPRSPGREHVSRVQSTYAQTGQKWPRHTAPPGTDGAGPAWPGLKALHLQAPVPVLPRCDEGRLVQFWAPRAQPVAPGDTRACCPKGEAPEEVPELVSSFVLPFLPASLGL